MESKKDEKEGSIPEFKSAEVNPMKMVQTKIPETVLLFAKDQSPTCPPEANSNGTKEDNKQ